MKFLCLTLSIAIFQGALAQGSFNGTCDGVCSRNLTLNPEDVIKFY